MIYVIFGFIFLVFAVMEVIKHGQMTPIGMGFVILSMIELLFYKIDKLENNLRK